MGSDEVRVLDALTGQVAAELLARSHLLAPEQVADALMDTAGSLGVTKARVYLADLEQRHLRAVPGGAGESPEMLAIDSTVAGHAYRTLRIHGGPVGDGGSRHRAWVPLVDGTERLGVLELTVAEMGDAMLARYEMLASFAALTIVSKSHYSDTYAQTRRSQPMALQAEMVWAFLPPRTFATDGVMVTATLEPAYEVGGDAYDYSLTGNRLHVSVFDAVGHDLAAGLLASVAMASCRSARRSGGTLQDIVTRTDHAIARQFGDSRFVTALLCDLDVATGVFSWIACGHPPPLLIRGNKVIKELAGRPQPPLGLAEHHMGADRSIYRTLPGSDDGLPACTEQLEPGDRMLLYTDGVTEGRAADGSRFGIDLLSDFIIHHSHAGTPAPEMLRRLTRTITEYQHGRLSDERPILASRGIRRAAKPTGTSWQEEARLWLGTSSDYRNLRDRRIAVAGTGRDRDSGQAVALQTARASRGTWRSHRLTGLRATRSRCRRRSVTGKTSGHQRRPASRDSAASHSRSACSHRTRPPRWRRST
jgi:hypothetical protein